MTHNLTISTKYLRIDSSKMLLEICIDHMYRKEENYSRVSLNYFCAFLFIRYIRHKIKACTSTNAIMTLKMCYIYKYIDLYLCLVNIKIQL